MSKQPNERFSLTTLEMLREAGWFPGRDVSADIQQPAGFTLFPAALNALKEFGLLHIGRRGPGVEFVRTPVIIDPMLGLGEDERFIDLSEIIHTKLYPLGETEDRHGFLAIDEYSRVFLIMGDLCFVGNTVDEGLENLLNGLKKPRLFYAVAK